VNFSQSKFYGNRLCGCIIDYRIVQSFSSFLTKIDDGLAYSIGKSSRFGREIGRSQGLTCEHPLIYSKLTSENAKSWDVVFVIARICSLSLSHFLSEPLSPPSDGFTGRTQVRTKRLPCF